MPKKRLEGDEVLCEATAQEGLLPGKPNVPASKRALTFKLLSPKAKAKESSAQIPKVAPQKKNKLSFKRIFSPGKKSKKADEQSEPSELDTAFESENIFGQNLIKNKDLPDCKDTNPVTEAYQMGQQAQ